LRYAAAWVALALIAVTPIGCGAVVAGHPRSTGAHPSGSGRPVRPRHAVADFDGDDYEVGGDADDDDSSPPYDRDGDADGEPGRLYDQDDGFLGFGRVANAGDRRHAQVLVLRYFSALAAQDGRVACSLMLASVAAEIPEIYGEKVPRPRIMHGSTCPQIAASAFAFYGRQLRAEASSVQVKAVRVHGRSALVLLEFGPRSGLPLRLIALARERGRWRVDGMLDNELG
jgi:hypothetical protein